MKKVRKAIIPAAGLGTRFLPATKTVPKEMLTIVDAPIIFYVVEEAVKAGIEDIILIQGRNKSAIEDFFDTSYELEERLAKDGKHPILKRLLKIKDMVNLITVRQKTPLGLGHAVLCGERVVGNEPFAVLLGDEIMVSPTGKPNCTESLASLYEANQASTISVMPVEQSEVSKYGVAELTAISENHFQVKRLVEKPSPEKAPSNWALPGRYIFSPDIFSVLREAKPSLHGEIQLTDAMNVLAQRSPMFAARLLSERFDAGDKLGYLKANIELGLRHKDLAPDLFRFLENVISRKGPVNGK